MKHFSKIIDSLEMASIFDVGFDFNAYYLAFNET